MTYERKIQYGVQVVWKDPVKAGVPTGQEPRWADFDTKEQADNFAALYESTLGQMARRMPTLAHTPGFDPDEKWKDAAVAVVNRATRWAIEAYGEWSIT